MRLLSVHSALVLCLLAASASADEEDLNVTQLGRLDEHFKYNDVWGYVAPDGREYALVGEDAGTVFINATDPTAPYEVGYIPFTQCLWRDIKCWGKYVYIVTDCQGGVQVVDMDDPENPVLVNEFGASFFGHAHNVQIDLDTGKLYAVGTNKGMVVYDLAVDPIDPPMIKQWNGGGFGFGDPYVHDIHVYNGVAYLSNISSGYHTLMDVSNLPSTSIISKKLSGAEFTHASWVNEDETLVVLCDEKAGDRNIIVRSLANPGNPITIADLSQGPGTVPHNPFIIGDVVHASYYEDGYRAFRIDAENESHEVIGRFDTVTNNPPGGFNGSWGCYPFQPSGYVYLSDMQRGLFIVKLNEPCPSSPLGVASLCDVSLRDIEMGQAPPVLLLSGADMDTATAVHVGEETFPSAQFDVQDAQVIAVHIATPTKPGLLPVTIENPFGLSETRYIQVIDPAAPLLETVPENVAVGESIVHTLSSDPGDTQFLALSFSATPSEIPGKVSFAIGNGFSELILLPAFPAGPGGVTTLPGLDIPAAGAGLTVLWQYAALDSGASLPAATSNVTFTIVE